MAPSISPRLEVRDLRLLVAVADEGTLSGATRRLHVTQPALSRHLRQLEARLGHPLFARTGARMLLLPPGDLLVRHARDLLAQLALAEEDFRDATEAARDVLRVGTECHTAYHWLPKVLGRFSAQHPRVDVDIAFEVGRRPLGPLLAAELDIALVSEGYRNQGLSITRLFSDEFVVVVAPGHPWATRTHVEPAAFVGERLLLLVPPRDSTVLKDFLHPAGVVPRQVADVQLVGALVSLVEAQLGVGVLASWTVASEIRSGRLVALRLGRGGLRRHWVAAVQKGRLQQRPIQDFVQLLATQGPMSGLDPAPARGPR